MKEKAIQYLKKWEKVSNKDICNIIEQIIRVYSHLENSEKEKFLVEELSDWENKLR